LLAHPAPLHLTPGLLRAELAAPLYPALSLLLAEMVAPSQVKAEPSGSRMPAPLMNLALIFFLPGRSAPFSGLSEEP
jgi:hypothetical protein